jgi:hypothetical protein
MRSDERRIDQDFMPDEKITGMNNGCNGAAFL